MSSLEEHSCKTCEGPAMATIAKGDFKRLQDKLSEDDDVGYVDYDSDSDVPYLSESKQPVGVDVITADVFGKMCKTMREVLLAVLCLPPGHGATGDIPTPSSGIFLPGDDDVAYMKLTAAQTEYYIEHPPGNCTPAIVQTMLGRLGRLTDWYSKKTKHPDIDAASDGEDAVAHEQYCAAVLAGADACGVAAVIKFLAYAPSWHMCDNPSGLWFIFGMKGKAIVHGFMEKAEEMVSDGRITVTDKTDHDARAAKRLKSSQQSPSKTN